MQNTKIKSLHLQKINIPKEISSDSFTIINPIETLSKEENEEIVMSCIESLKELDNPDRWMTWEEAKRKFKEEHNV